MQNFETDRERAANDLAERLFFELEKQGNRYSLYQDRRSCAERWSDPRRGRACARALEARRPPRWLTPGPIELQVDRSRLQPRA